MSQALSTPHHTHAEAVAKLADLISGTKVCMLTTLENGEPIARPMGVVDSEFDGTLWFVSDAESRKAGHLQTDPRVNVTYSSGSKWVSIRGKGSVVRDLAKLKQVWNGGLDAWFPDGPEAPNTVLLRIEAEGAEYWDTPGGAVVASALSFIKSKTTGKPLEIENDKVDM